MINKEKIKISLSNISEFRSELMGLAIILVVLYHFTRIGGHDRIDIILTSMFKHGYWGVDVFMLVSGLGLTFSMLKNEDIIEFYIKRWIRIFPLFTFLTIIECCVIRDESLGLGLLRASTLGYWFSIPRFIEIPYIDWYVPAIVGIYTVFPLFFKYVLKPRRNKVCLALCLFFYFASIVMVFFPVLDWKHFCLFYRLPDFILGCLAALAIKDGYGQHLIKKIILISLLLGFFSYVVLTGYDYRMWITNMCFTPVYLLLIIYILLYIKSWNNVFSTLIVGCLSLLGTISLEMYRITSSFERLLTDANCANNHALYVALYFLICMALSYVTSIIFNRINNCLYSVFKKVRA